MGSLRRQVLRGGGNDPAAAPFDPVAAQHHVARVPHGDAAFVLPRAADRILLDADAVVQDRPLRVGGADHHGDARGPVLAAGTQSAVDHHVAGDGHIRGMRSLLPERLGAHVDRRARARPEDIVLDHHPARLAQHPAREVAPDDRTPELQARELRDIEQAVFAEILRERPPDPDPHVRRILPVEHLRHLDLPFGNERRDAYDLHAVAHTRDIGHLGMSEGGRLQFQGHRIPRNGRDVVVVTVDIRGVVALPAEQAPVERDGSFAAGEVRGVGIGREGIAVGRGDRQAEHRDVAAVEAHDAQLVGDRDTPPRCNLQCLGGNHIRGTEQAVH